MALKKLHKLLLTSYAGPFVMTFFVSLFVLLMQFLWKYIDDLVGKGLEWYIIAELLFYASASLVNMALPLAILLSSIMTLGNLGENYELVALRSAGISLGRIMYPLIIVAILTSVGAFYFANNVIPVSNLKMGTLLYDIRHQRPTMSLKPGVFYRGLQGYSIRTGSKGDDEQSLYDLIIYDHTDNKGNIKVTTADSGRMAYSHNERYMEFTLYSGKSYTQEDNPSRKSKTYPHSINQFDEELIRFDMSDFKLSRSSDEIFKDNYRMQSFSQLRAHIDSFKVEKVKRHSELANNIKKNYKYVFPELMTATDSVKMKYGARTRLILPMSTAKDSVLNNFPTGERKNIATTALNLSRSVKAYLSSITEDARMREHRMDRYEIEIHRKLTLSVACLVLFFIGAPLGAIIRKGGLGLPVIVSVLFFLLYYVISITGEKFAKEGVWTPAEGMWLSSVVLMPIGIFLTYKATTDSHIFNIGAYFDPIKNGVLRLLKKDKAE
ncbi:MAG: lipopolysaccharide export system permease protein [Bacteroidia bacterium]